MILTFKTHRKFVIGRLPALGLWRRNHVSRKALRHLDEAALHDLALTRDDVSREMAKWFWQT